MTNPESIEVAALMQRIEDLRLEQAKLQEVCAELRQRLEIAESGRVAARESRRAALNLMEDAVHGGEKALADGR